LALPRVGTFLVYGSVDLERHHLVRVEEATFFRSSRDAFKGCSIEHGGRMLHQACASGAGALATRRSVTRRGWRRRV